MKYISIIITFLLPILIKSSITDATFFNNDKVIVHITDKDLYLDLEDYVFGVVSSEMPALFEDEALKAQAVAARSYAMSKVSNNIISVKSNTSDQLYKTNYELLQKWGNKYSEYQNKIRKDVEITKNEVIKRNNKILKTYYFSMSNGYTENSETVFKETLFESVSSPLEKELSNFEVTKEISTSDFIKALKTTSPVTISNIERSQTNHVNSITINNKKYTGIEIRKLLGLRSTDFTIEKKDNNYVITTRGYGHGVGMSQYGANMMAKDDYDYSQILMHYYKNTDISKIDV